MENWMDVIQSILISQEDVGVRKENYYNTARKLYLCDKDWYGTSNNRLLLQNIFFNFVVINLNKPLFHTTSYTGDLIELTKEQCGNIEQLKNQKS